MDDQKDKDEAYKYFVEAISTIVSVADIDTSGAFAIFNSADKILNVILNIYNKIDFYRNLMISYYLVLANIPLQNHL